MRRCPALLVVALASAALAATQGGRADGGRPEGGRAESARRGAPPPDAGRPDAGAARGTGAKLSALECERLIDTIVVLSVTETIAKDPEAQRLPAEQRAMTAKLARRQALADPQLEKLKRACPDRYTHRQERCILTAKTMEEIDACSK